MDFVDLYLIHWPVEKVRNQTWEKLEEILEKRKARAIGVSNFTKRHLEELFKTSKIIPTINQIEFNPYLFQKEILEFCNKKEIQVEAYSPLTRGKKLNDPKLAEIAKKYSKSPAQILIRWGLQTGLVVLPKSKTTERIKENSKVFDFEISSEDMLKINGFNENFRACWDPTNAP